MKIFLIGLPGSGKTTLGKALAAHLASSFVDLDSEVEQAEGQSIQSLFSKKGEDYFRKCEAAALARCCQATGNFVMATGGGTPCFHDNLKTMNQAGLTIFLDVPSREIAERLKRTNLAERPLLARLNDDDLKDKIEFLRSQRINAYRNARITLTGATISPNDLITKITNYTQP